MSDKEKRPDWTSLSEKKEQTAMSDKAEEIESLKQILIDNYKKGNNGKRRNCLGSIESNIKEIFKGLTAKDIFQSHTNQTLDKLKEKVLDIEPEMRNTTLVRKEEILNLIDKLQDDSNNRQPTDL